MTDIDYGAFGCPVKMWLADREVLDELALDQITDVSQLSFVKGIAVMPDVHPGMGSTIGTVIATDGAVIPAAVGVDIGCGMRYAELDLTEDQIGVGLEDVYECFDMVVPNGRTNHGQKGDVGAWTKVPELVQNDYRSFLHDDYEAICKVHPRLRHPYVQEHLGTLGSGNHFVELTVNLEGKVGVLIHSGSRGPGNKIATHFIRAAKSSLKQMRSDAHGYECARRAGHPKPGPIPFYEAPPNNNLAYLLDGTQLCSDYITATMWAQSYALVNRRAMMRALLDVIQHACAPNLIPTTKMIDCHHNFLSLEEYDGKRLWITRKGATKAGLGCTAIIPGSMGRGSPTYIAQGLGNEESYNSCAHGAGRRMSRTQAKKLFTVEDHVRDTVGIVCRKTEDMIDETERCYKPIQSVMGAQKDLVKGTDILRTLVCVKGHE